MYVYLEVPLVYRFSYWVIAKLGTIQFSDWSYSAFRNLVSFDLIYFAFNDKPLYDEKYEKKTMNKMNIIIVD